MSQSPFDSAANPYLSPASAAPPESEPYGGQAVTALTVELLRQTRPWARLMSILTFLWATLMLVGSAIGAIFLVGSGNAIQSPFMLVYLAFGLLVVPPAIYLFRYASRIAQLERSGSMTGLEEALEAQKSFWRFVGILTSVALVFYAILLMLVVVLGVGLSVFR